MIHRHPNQDEPTRPTDRRHRRGERDRSRPTGDRRPRVGVLNETDAATYLSVGVKTLRNWRSLGQGPPYVRIGRRIGYRPEDLAAWVESRRVDPGGVL